MLSTLANGRVLCLNLQVGCKPLTASLSGSSKRNLLVLWLMTSELSNFNFWKESPLVKTFLGSFGFGEGFCMMRSVAAEGADWVWEGFWKEAA